MKNKVNSKSYEDTFILQTKRFVIRKSLIGKNTIIVFKNHKNVECKYNHDVVYDKLKDKFDNMMCFEKYGSYTNSKNLPKFVRELDSII